jgi:hypothetical protein
MATQPRCNIRRPAPSKLWMRTPSRAAHPIRTPGGRGDGPRAAGDGTGRRHRDGPGAHRARLGAAPRPHCVRRLLARPRASLQYARLAGQMMWRGLAGSNPAGPAGLQLAPDSHATAGAAEDQRRKDKRWPHFPPGCSRRAGGKRPWTFRWPTGDL